MYRCRGGVVHLAGVAAAARPLVVEQHEACRSMRSEHRSHAVRWAPFLSGTWCGAGEWGKLRSESVKSKCERLRAFAGNLRGCGNQTSRSLKEQHFCTGTNKHARGTRNCGKLRETPKKSRKSFPIKKNFPIKKFFPIKNFCFPIKKNFQSKFFDWKSGKSQICKKLPTSIPPPCTGRIPHATQRLSA